MRIIAAITATLIAAVAMPAAAQTYIYEEVTHEWVEPAAQRFVSPQLAQAEQSAIAAYGPFRVLDGTHAALVGVTDENSPAQFDRMLAAYPAIDTLEFIDCPGTFDDRANLRLGRMIRAHDMAAVVPEGGSVRSGAVELFLAGSTRAISSGAEFAVHAWLDDLGRSAWDYPADSPEHTRYLDYYREMGMDADEAARFYAMTNSAPFESALWLTGDEMSGWIATPGVSMPVQYRADTAEDAPQGLSQGLTQDGGLPLPPLPYIEIAYLDLSPRLN